MVTFIDGRFILMKQKFVSSCDRPRWNPLLLFFSLMLTLMATVNILNYYHDFISIREWKKINKSSSE